MKGLLSYLWNLPLCAFGFMLGLIASGSVLPALGIEPPAPPAGADANMILLWHLLGSVLMALALGTLSRWLPAGFAFRWLALSALAWSVSALSTVLEASIFMSTGATASPGSLAFTAASYLLPCVALAGAAAWLFPPAAQAEAGWRRAGRWWVSRPAQAWGVRLAAAWAAFPVIYVACGWLVQPFIVGYYAGGQFELAAPSWAQILPLQLARGLLFLLACLPTVAAWRASQRRLAVTLGPALFVLAAFMPVITAYWFPWPLRLFHGLELLASSLVYACALAGLLGPANGAFRVRSGARTA